VVIQGVKRQLVNGGVKAVAVRDLGEAVVRPPLIHGGLAHARLAGDLPDGIGMSHAVVLMG
jgi:hypothetical protein